MPAAFAARFGAPLHRWPSASARSYDDGIDAQAFRRRRRRRRGPPPSSRTGRCPWRALAILRLVVVCALRRRAGGHGCGPVVGGRRCAVARSPCVHCFANPLLCPFRRDSAGMAAFAICVGVAPAVPGRGGRPAAATHSAVARLDRARRIADRIVEVALDGCLCASQPTSDLRDRQPLLVTVMAGELRRAAPFAHAVEHKPPKSAGFAGQPKPSANQMVRRGGLLVSVPLRPGEPGARDRAPVPA
jgi:hypothetical protein